MDGSKPLSISSHDLYQIKGTAAAPITTDVRRNPALLADSGMIGGALRRVARAYGEATGPLDRGTYGGA